MRHLLDRFYAALMALAALALLGTFVCVMLGIIDRQVGWGLRGLDAYAGYGIAAALFLALPSADLWRAVYDLHNNDLARAKRR